MADTALIDKLKSFMEQEARSYSIDFGCITPEYVYRCWGGTVTFEEIEKALEEMIGKFKVKSL